MLFSDVEVVGARRAGGARKPLVNGPRIPKVEPMKKLSLVRSLLLFSMLTSGVGLLLFCAGFLIFDLHSFRTKKGV